MTAPSQSALVSTPDRHRSDSAISAGLTDLTLGGKDGRANGSNGSNGHSYEEDGGGEEVQESLVPYGHGIEHACRWGGSWEC